jgi:hypothetical protein
LCFGANSRRLCWLQRRNLSLLTLCLCRSKALLGKVDCLIRRRPNTRSLNHQSLNRVLEDLCLYQHRWVTWCISWRLKSLAPGRTLSSRLDYRRRRCPWGRTWHLHW